MSALCRALGIMFYELATGSRPDLFQLNTDKPWEQLKGLPERYRIIIRQVCDLARYFDVLAAFNLDHTSCGIQMLNHDPAARPSCSEILERLNADDSTEHEQVLA